MSSEGFQGYPEPVRRLIEQFSQSLYLRPTIAPPPDAPPGRIAM